MKQNLAIRNKRKMKIILGIMRFKVSLKSKKMTEIPRSDGLLRTCFFKIIFIKKLIKYYHFQNFALEKLS